MFNVTNQIANRYVSTIITKLRENNLTYEFMEHDPQRVGYRYNTNWVTIKLAQLMGDDEYYTPAFRICCRIARSKLLEKRMYRARFRGIVRAIIVLRRIRLRALHRMYAPPDPDVDVGGDGYVTAAKDFMDRVTIICTVVPPPMPPPMPPPHLPMPPSIPEIYNTNDLKSET